MDRLTKLVRVEMLFSAKRRACELKLFRLEDLRQRDLIERSDVRYAMDSPVVCATLLLSSVTRRLARIDGRIDILDQEISMIRDRLRSARVKEKFSGQLAEGLRKRAQRKRSEHETVEAGARHVSSLRQDSDD